MPGEILALGRFPPLDLAVVGFLTLFFISGSATISNDYFDRHVDEVDQPSRPLPSGRISVAELWALVFLFTVAGLTAAGMLGPPVLALAAAARGGRASLQHEIQGSWPFWEPSRRLLCLIDLYSRGVGSRGGEWDYPDIRGTGIPF
ncbi:MAG: UbiA family prenyltransferase [Methanomicrobiaceae archaeon]|nr:UbiA family prenyltransferase [Methanomicrobiaceae archaeon]